MAVDDRIIEQVSSFNYLGSEYYVKDRDIDKKMNKFQAVCSIINRTLGNKVRRDTKLRFHKVINVLVLVYGSQKDRSRMQTGEIKFLMSVKCCTG